MMNELDLKYKQLKEKEAEEKEKKKERYKKAVKAVLTSILVVLGLFFLLIVLMVVDDFPTQAKLESEYTEFFENPCVKSRALARERGEDWSNQVKQTIIGQAKRDFLLSGRKEIYETHRRDCSRLINSGVVRDMAEVKTMIELSRSRKQPDRKQPEKIPIERRTRTGVPIEKGADLDHRIDSDKIINLSVNRIRSRGYRCNSVSRIQLYNYPDRISVYCNGDKDKYWIQKDAAGLFSQVTRL